MSRWQEGAQELTYAFFPSNNLNSGCLGLQWRALCWSPMIQESRATMENKDLSKPRLDYFHLSESVIIILGLPSWVTVGVQGETRKLENENNKPNMFLKFEKLKMKIVTP